MWIVAPYVCRLDIKTIVVTNAGLDLMLNSNASLDCTAGGKLIIVMGAEVDVFDPRTRQLHTVARVGETVAWATDWAKSLVVVDSEQCAFIADRQANCIRRVTLPPAFFQ